MNRIILSDSTEITGFERFNNYFLFEEGMAPTEEQVSGKLSPVIVEYGEEEDTVREVIPNAVLLTNIYCNPNMIGFRGKTEYEILQEDYQSKIDYLAMMTDVEM